MPSHKEDAELFSPVREFQYVGGFQNAVAVINNLVARATTQWNLEESKLFILSVSQIEQRDKDCWIKMRKRDVINTLGVDPRYTSELKKKLISVKQKSRIELHGPKAQDWEMGDIIRTVKTDRHYVYVQFEERYVPLLHYVKDELFTKFEIQNVMGLNHKASYNLYLYLSSWHNANYLINKRNINKSKLPRVFNLKEGQYWRNYGTDKAKFDWNSFERRCLYPAIQDINSNSHCDLKIDSWMKVKDPEKMKYVLGYAFTWHYENEDGSYKIQGKTPLLNSETMCTFEDLNHVAYFMKRFKNLNDIKLKKIAEIIEITVSPVKERNDPWTVKKLKQEQKKDCISQDFYDDLKKCIQFDNDYQFFAKLFGYDQDQLPDPAQNFLEDLEGIRAKLGA